MPPVDVVSTERAIASYRDDQSLADRMARRDATAWKTFIETHGRLVRSRVADVASSFGRENDESAIDDATAEVFAALLRNDAAALRAFGGRSSLGTYVAVIATRSATRGFSRYHANPLPTTEDHLNTTADHDHATDPANAVMNAEQYERLHGLLDRLPEKQRNVVSLFHLQGKSYTAISDELDIPIGSIGPTLRRAEEKLRQWMQHD